jgi:uncharacterized protein (TIGR02266 family)
MAAGSSSETQTTIERRRSARTPVVVRVEYGTVDALFSEFTRDVNEGGLFVATDTPLALDERVHLHFRLPGSDEPIRGSGRVVWTRGTGEDEPAGMGIRFEELEPSARTRIDELVRSLRSR